MPHKSHSCPLPYSLTSFLYTVFTLHLGSQAPEDDASRLQHFRHGVGKVVESFVVQQALMVLLLLDILIIYMELTFEANAFGGLYCEVDEHTLEAEIEEREWLMIVLDVLFWCSISILFIFLTESMLLIFAYGFRFFTHLGYVLDLFVVTASIILELTLRDTFSEIIIVLRLWRVLRILHALYEEIHVNKAHAVKMERKKFERSQSAMTDEP